jgi:hypothetical protein
MSAWRRVAVALLAVLVAALGPAVSASGADAEVSMFASEPTLDEGGGEIAIWLGGFARGPGRVSIESPGLQIGGSSPVAPSAVVPLMDLAKQSRGDSTWRPPVVLSIIYQWAEEATPPEVLQGIHRLAARAPESTTIIPTPYGEGYPKVANPVSAARVAGGDLDEIQAIRGTSMMFLDAAAFNLTELRKDSAPVKAAVIVTDGRDLTATDKPAAWAALGQRLAEAGVVTQVVMLAPPSDAALCERNVRALADAAGARLFGAGRAADLPPLIEAAGLLLFDMKRATFEVPLRKRMFGGRKSLALVASINGTETRKELPALRLPWSGLGVTLLSLLVVIVVAGVALPLVLRGRARSGGHEAFLDDLQGLIQRGVLADRAVVELSRWHPDDVDEIEGLEPAKLDPVRYRVLRSRAGASRLQEIKKVLRSSRDVPGDDDEVMTLIAQGLDSDAPVDEVSARIGARVPANRWALFARLGLKELADALRQAATVHPVLKTPRARTYALDLQDRLRRDSGGGGLAVAWLVRASGPGRRGQTLALAGERVVVGKASGSQLKVDEDPSVADRHLEISLEGGQFCIKPLDGRVLLDGQAVEAVRSLSDGATLEFGGGRYVFKCIFEG